MATAVAQNITATITNASAPAASATSPHFVIDSDATNPNAGYTRDTIPAAVEVQFNWVGGFTSGTETYRATVELIDPVGNVVTLSTGGSSASQSVSLAAWNTSTTRTFNLSPDPAVDLGAGEEYKLRYRVQRWSQITLGGSTFFTWLTAAGPVDSSPFTVIHFPDQPEDPQARYLRGYLRGAPTWVKQHAIDTALLTSARSFRVSIPYTHARYDVGGVTESVNTRFILEMEDDLGNPVPLQNDGIVSANFSRPAFNSGTPNTPYLISGSFNLDFRSAVQLDARNRTYKLRVRFEHLEIPATNSYIDGGTSPDGSFAQLLHFNGNLRFGPEVGGLMTNFSFISNTPTPGTAGPDYVNTTLNVTFGTVPGFPDYIFGDGSPLGVRLMVNGDSIVTSGSQPLTVAGGGNVETDFNGLTVAYPSVSLTSSGPVAGSAVVWLPQGLSYAPSRSSAAGRYESEISFGGPITLDGQFQHGGNLSQALPADAWVFDESRPLLYQVSNCVLFQDGELEFTAADAEWAHQQAFDQLAAQQAGGLHETPDMATRFSNDGYLRFAAMNPGAKARFAAAADATNRCVFADLTVDPGDFTTHFPVGTPVEWNNPGEIQIRDGLIEPGSKLGNAGTLAVAFDGSCPDDPCGPAGGAVASLNLTPLASDLFLTPDGGLQTPGAITPAELFWGIRGDLSFTHRTDLFETAHFLAGGNQIYDELNPVAASGPQQDVAGDLAPGVITLAGFDPDNPNLPVYAGTPDYQVGTGVWPGATVVVENSGHIGASRIADQVSEYAYFLQQEASKYYVRRSGVSGRHVAEEKSFDASIVLYGYQFELTRFQLTFLSNENERSWINGIVAVPNPSNFVQAFRELRLSCVGALESAEIDPDDAGAKPLAYWNGSFTPLAMRFAPEAGAGCYDDRFLTLGLISGAANIDSPLAGTL
ncbi:MAG TPA: hypothetical protein VLO11_14195, partial [Luteolibacter sp.]|nr:hypothetical protein [Luteolibacter sp.]